MQEGKSGRILRRPQQDYPAATVDQFCTAVLTFAALGDLFSPGPTGTNVNDFRAILIT
jgi:glycerate-2-kinase